MRNTILHYSFYGIFFGLCFPVTALSLDIIIHQLSFSWQGIQQAQTNNFLHSIIDLAPFILGFMGYRIGQNKYQLEQHVLNLERSILERTQTLYEMAEEAKAANEAKSAFLSQMSHEFHTPLNAILGFSQLLKLEEEHLKEDENIYVSEIITAGEHLVHLVNKMLDLAKIEAHQIEIKLERMTLNAVVDEALQTLDYSIKKRNISLINRINNHNCFILVDKIRLKQVLINLLSNAVKHNKENGSITLWCEKITESQLRLYIKDTGVGLTEEDIERLFIPFQRITSKENIEGTGVGLSISKNLMLLMNGDIGVKSTIHQGTTFWIEFKLV